MARFMNLTVAEFQGAGPVAEQQPAQRVMLNIEHIVAISEGKARTGYPNGFTMITMRSIGEGGTSEVYFVSEKLETIARNLPI